MLREFWSEISDLLFSHWGVLLGALFALIAFLFGRWILARKPKLSKDAKWVLDQIKRDQTYDVKGITIMTHDRMANYWFFRMQPGDEKRFDDESPRAVGMFYYLQGETLRVVQGTEELVEKCHLTVESQDSSTTVFRLKA